PTAIERFFADVQAESLAFVMHNVTNPLVAVDGDSAVGRWQLLMPCTMRQADELTAVWAAGHYEDRFVRGAGGWQIAEMRLTSYFWSSQRDGWAAASVASESDRSSDL
ncbi:MAG: nuclear transport factor 2 family protein, partial [Gaiellaceae bacterium]